MSQLQHTVNDGHHPPLDLESNIICYLDIALLPGQNIVYSLVDQMLMDSDPETGARLLHRIQVTAKVGISQERGADGTKMIAWKDAGKGICGYWAKAPSRRCVSKMKHVNMIW